MKTISIKVITLAIAAMAAFSACDKTFDKLPASELDASLAYRNVYDANASVMGVYGKFMNLADRYVILNELRADLLTCTDNADQDLRDISAHSVKKGNPYANPRPFYELINNCNDILKNFNIMLRDKKLKQLEYDQRYSDIGFLRSFLYLQLGIHYGDQVRYVTEPVEDILAINNLGTYQPVPFEKLIDTLIRFTKGLPYIGQYTAEAPNTVGPALNLTLDGVPTGTLFIPKQLFLGELYLWKGDYKEAAINYRAVMETTTGPITEAGLAQYKLGYSNVSRYVSYATVNRARVLDYSVGWRTIFERNYETEYAFEIMWAMPYLSKFSTPNPLIKLFSPIGGNYLLKPSQAIMENWSSQTQNPLGISGSNINYGTPDYDARGPLSTMQIGGQLVAMKNLCNYINYTTRGPINPLAKDGKWFIYRQTHLHLHFAEAANRDHYHRLAYAIAESGIGNAYRGPDSIKNVTPFMNTLSYPPPYNFDARNSDNVPSFRAPWYRNIGVRARANVAVNVYPAGTDSLILIENNIINEGALEQAFEGHRWPDLLRIAIRRGAGGGGSDFLQEKINNKFLKEHIGGGPTTDFFSNKSNWYLPFDLQ